MCNVVRNGIVKREREDANKMKQLQGKEDPDEDTTMSTIISG